MVAQYNARSAALIRKRSAESAMENLDQLIQETQEETEKFRQDVAQKTNEMEQVDSRDADEKIEDLVKAQASLDRAEKKLAGLLDRKKDLQTQDQETLDTLLQRVKGSEVNVRRVWDMISRLKQEMKSQTS